MVSDADDSDQAASATPADDATPADEDEPIDESHPETDTGHDVTDVTDDEQTWAVVLHASAFSGLVVPFGNILGPLLVWLIKKDESEFLDASGKEALNFQLTWTIMLLGALLSILLGIGFLLVPVVVVAWIVLVVLGTVRASEREIYDYPLTIDLID